jgi:hypothetical protein
MTRDSIFISYSQDDAVWLTTVKKHLSILEHKYQLVVWDDTRIEAGSRWQDEIEKAIKKCKIAILLVSSNFLASRFIAENELPKILNASEREGVTIINVIIDTCAFDLSDLRVFQCINNPDSPLAEISTPDVKKHLVKLATTIVKTFDGAKGDDKEEGYAGKFLAHSARILVLAFLTKNGTSSITDVEKATFLERKLVHRTLEELTAADFLIKSKEDPKKKPSVFWKASELGLKSFNEFESSYLRILKQPSS